LTGTVGPMPYDLLALGETMVALAPPPGDTMQTAPHLTIDHAGAESNTCVGLARLGFRVAWISRLGADTAGDRIVETLGAEGIDMRWVRRDPARPTGLMLKERDRVRYYRTGSAASAITPGDLDNVPVRDARAVLVTGVTALVGPGPHAAGLALLSAASGIRIVDPNLRDGLWGSDRRVDLVRTFVERSDFLLTGAGELQEILDGRARAVTVSCDEELARRAAAGGPREIVVRSADRVSALSDGVWRTVAIERRASVDPTGAGDAFNAGYIAVRLRGGSIDDALRAAVRCGSAVTSATSDTAGFPRSLA
jgi:2-dehydro-3-deoxygluconokinase